MLERKGRDQLELFITGSLEQLVPEDHVLARVDRVLDLGWLREEVADCYCADNGRPGIDPSGRKVYIVKTRNQGRIIKMTIGPHDAVSATYARVRAAEIITDARAGKNPKGRRSNAPTMRALGERFLKEYVPNHCKPSTAAEYRRSVELFINPRIGKLRVPDVQRSKIAALHHDMHETPYQVNRTLGLLSKMFTLAELWELRPDGSNPCRHVKRFKDEKRERFLSDAEYRRLGSALREIEQGGSEMAAAIAAIRLLILTGCRLSEIQNLR